MNQRNTKLRCSTALLTAALTLGFVGPASAEEGQMWVTGEQAGYTSPSQARILNKQFSYKDETYSLIVKFRQPLHNLNKAAQAQGRLQRAELLSKAAGAKIEFGRLMSGNAEVYWLDRMMPVDQVKALVRKIEQLPDVEYAEPDVFLQIRAVPNDTRYNEQWHYSDPTGGMNLPAAWDISTGSSNAVVAVLDTGYRPHADLNGNILPGYDMISDSFVGNDGNGRDNDARDPGDWTLAGECGTGSPAQDQNSSWHGTHVAGTVGAMGNNGTGVTGVNWNVGIVPVRVLGKCGGSLSDIADGIRWAAGLSVPGVPANANPADVINMSLGSSSPGTCTSTYQNAINDARGQGTTIVVAAGNDNNTANYPPGNCAGVITVAATNKYGMRAYYSNYGSNVDVAAPGGEICTPKNGVDVPQAAADCQEGGGVNSNMILSTYNAGTQGPGADSYGWLQGTSMATPHVAGLAGLMYSVNPNLTPDQVETMLKSTARAFPTVSWHQCDTSLCGAGIVDAQAALQAAQGNGGGGGGGGNAGPTVLSNGVPVSGLSLAKNAEQMFTIEVPAGATDLNVVVSGNNGDADVYVRAGAAPTTTTYDARGYTNGSNENVTIATPTAGTYYIMLRAYAAFSNVTLTASYTESTGGGGGGGTTNELNNGETRNGLSATKGNPLYYTIQVPANATNLRVVTTGNNGDADVYMKFGAAPTTSSYDARGYKSGSNEDVTVATPQAGTWHIMINPYASFTNVSMTVSYTENTGGGGGANQSGPFENASNYSIPDNNATGIESPIDVPRSGDSGTVSVSVDIRHTWRGDLKVVLVAPNGTTAVLKDVSSNDSADNVIATYSVNATGVDSQGVWKLRVTDNARQDTGYINRWSIAFDGVTANSELVPSFY